jgi:hypothetical protein
VNERKHTHTVWFYLERRNKREINLGVIVIGGWDWCHVYRIIKFEYVNHGISCAPADVNTVPRGGYTLGEKNLGGRRQKGGETPRPFHI